MKIPLEMMPKDQKDTTLRSDVVETTIEAIYDYALKVAGAVRQECAEKATIRQVGSRFNSVTNRSEPAFGVDPESILSVDIEQFIK